MPFIPNIPDGIDGKLRPAGVSRGLRDFARGVTEQEQGPALSGPGVGV